MRRVRACGVSAAAIASRIDVLQGAIAIGRKMNPAAPRPQHQCGFSSEGIPACRPRLFKPRYHHIDQVRRQQTSRAALRSKSCRTARCLRHQRCQMSRRARSAGSQHAWPTRILYTLAQGSGARPDLVRPLFLSPLAHEVGRRSGQASRRMRPLNEAARRNAQPAAQNMSILIAFASAALLIAVLGITVSGTAVAQRTRRSQCEWLSARRQRGKHDPRPDPLGRRASIGAPAMPRRLYSAGFSGASGHTATIAV